jgi:hypothetical protein
MAIVRHLVELHGGLVTAASEGKDQGATFTVRLPVAASPGSDPKPRRSGNARLCRGPEVFCHPEPIVVEIDHQYGGFHPGSSAICTCNDGATLAVRRAAVWSILNTQEIGFRWEFR